MNDLMSYEREYIEKGYRYIAGVDEVGRGPLAGPVAVCAVIMDLNAFVEGVNDSKKLTEKKRELLFPQLQKYAIDYRVVMKTPEEIDEINILKATITAMEEAVLSLQPNPDVVLVDAVKLQLPYPTVPILQGDAKSYSIAAASILAKVTRDRLMTELDRKYPEYGFKNNKGYGTKEHIEAIKNYGITPLHRKSFVGNFWTGKYYAENEVASDRFEITNAKKDVSENGGGRPI